MSDSLRPYESQHAWPPCLPQTPGVYSNSCPSSRWIHPAISSSVVPFSSCPQSLPASGSFLMSQLFGSSGQSIGVSASASVLPMNTQDWSPSGWRRLNLLVKSPCSPRDSQESSPTPQFCHLEELQIVGQPQSRSRKDVYSRESDGRANLCFSSKGHAGPGMFPRKACR